MRSGSQLVALVEYPFVIVEMIAGLTGIIALTAAT